MFFVVWASRKFCSSPECVPVWTTPKHSEICFMPKLWSRSEIVLHMPCILETQYGVWYMDWQMVQTLLIEHFYWAWTARCVDCPLWLHLICVFWIWRVDQMYLRFLIATQAVWYNLGIPKHDFLWRQAVVQPIVGAWFIDHWAVGCSVLLRLQWNYWISNV